MPKKVTYRKLSALNWQRDENTRKDSVEISVEMCNDMYYTHLLNIPHHKCPGTVKIKKKTIFEIFMVSFIVITVAPQKLNCLHAG